MLKKIFIQTLFDFQIPWIDKYIENVNTQEATGWDWIVFTDQPIQSKGNFKVVPMNVDAFIQLSEEKMGTPVVCKVRTTKYGDHSVAQGHVFEDFIKGYDFWGMTNFDVVYGNLSKYLPDDYLSTIDFYGNDPDAMCGPFSLIRNNDLCNRFYQLEPRWKEIMGDDKVYVFDEFLLTNLLHYRAKDFGIRFESGFKQEHDKQSNHLPNPRLKFRDGGLYNSITCSEMMMFHFKKKLGYPVND